MFTAEDIRQQLNVNVFLIESNLRALSKEKPFPMKLASICDENESPSIGYFNGNAKDKNYFFIRTK